MHSIILKAHQFIIYLLYYYCTKSIINNINTIDVKVDGSLFEEKSNFNMLGLSFTCELDVEFWIVSVVKFASWNLDSFYEIILC